MIKISQYVHNNLPYDLFTDRDLMPLVSGSDDSRYGLVKRALKTGEIIRLKRGIYCLPRESCRFNLNVYALSQFLYGPSYVSLESALSYHGWIPEGVFMTTCVSMKRKAVYKTPVGEFSYFHVPQKNFYEDVGHVTAKEGDFFLADPLKALCDYVYVHKKDWKGIKPLTKSLRVEEEQLESLKRDQFNRLADNYRSRRVRVFLNGVTKDLRL